MGSLPRLAGLVLTFGAVLAADAVAAFRVSMTAPDSAVSAVSSSGLSSLYLTSYTTTGVHWWSYEPVVRGLPDSAYEGSPPVCQEIVGEETRCRTRPGPVTVTGSSSRDVVQILGGSNGIDVAAVDTGGGDDLINVEGAGERGPIDAGTNSADGDTISVSSGFWHIDLAEGTAARTVGADTEYEFTNVENIGPPGGGENVLLGDDRPNRIEGSRQAFGGEIDADETIDGRGGDDILSGGAGDDRITGGPGADSISCGSGNDVVVDPEPIDNISADCERTDIEVNVDGDEGNAEQSAAEDECDVDRGEAGSQCTLRAAMQLANARGGATITFAIPGAPTISVSDSGLPKLTSPTTIDGSTQPGGMVEIVGPAASSPDVPGIYVAAGASASGGRRTTLRGLAVRGFSLGNVEVHADGALIEGNRIGTDAAGNSPAGTLIEDGRAMLEIDGDDNRVVGNVVAGGAVPMGGFDRVAAVLVRGDRNRVQGNRIGVAADGRLFPPPPATDSFARYVGVIVQGAGNVIGKEPSSGTGLPTGSCASPCNHIAGFDVAVSVGGLDFYRQEPHLDATDTALWGNWIGVAADGSVGTSPQGTTGIVEATGGDPATALGHRTSMVGNRVTVDSRGLVGVDHAHIATNAVSSPPTGFDVELRGATGAVVEAADGTEVTGNIIQSGSYRGLVVEASATTAGGDGAGVEVADNTIAQNPLGGILVLSGNRHLIEGNDVHDNGVAGIGVTHFSNPVPMATLRGNRVYANEVDIDLFAFVPTPVDRLPYGAILPTDGVTFNDAGDGDAGPNGFQNSPVPLAASLDGTTMRVSGFVDTPLLGGGPYRIEAFTSAACGRASVDGRSFGGGEHVAGAATVSSTLGYADFELSTAAVPATDRVVSLTATRVDEDGPLGATSEFSECLPLAPADRVARSTVTAGQTGTIQDGNGARVSIPAGGRRAVGAGHDGGTLFVTRYDTAATRHWLITDRGLTPAGGAASGRGATFEVCLDATGVTAGEPVVVRRGTGTAGTWTSYPTGRSGQYACAGGVTALGEFAIAAGTGTPTPTASPTATAGPSDPPVAKPKLERIGRRATVAGKAARLRIACGAGARCDGAVRLVARLGRKARRIGSKTFSIPAGRTATVKVKLSRRALRALRRKALKVRVTATAGPSRLTRTVRLKPGSPAAAP